eukprot:4511694-Pleurochrysis_carterae.AAC.4
MLYSARVRHDIDFASPRRRAMNVFINGMGSYEMESTGVKCDLLTVKLNEHPLRLTFLANVLAGTQFLSSCHPPEFLENLRAKIKRRSGLDAASRVTFAPRVSAPGSNGDQNKHLVLVRARCPTLAGGDVGTSRLARASGHAQSRPR